MLRKTPPRGVFKKGVSPRGPVGYISFRANPKPAPPFLKSFKGGFPPLLKRVGPHTPFLALFGKKIGRGKKGFWGVKQPRKFFGP